MSVMARQGRALRRTVGEALLWTLQRGLGSAWNDDLAGAWGAAYGVLSGFMVAEAYPRERAAE